MSRLAGDDTLAPLVGIDTIDGGDGNDLLVLDGSGKTSIGVLMTNGCDAVSGFDQVEADLF